MGTSGTHNEDWVAAGVVLGSLYLCPCHSSFVCIVQRYQIHADIEYGRNLLLIIMICSEPPSGGWLFYPPTFYERKETPKKRRLVTGNSSTYQQQDDGNSTPRRRQWSRQKNKTAAGGCCLGRGICPQPPLTSVWMRGLWQIIIYVQQARTHGTEESVMWKQFYTLVEAVKEKKGGQTGSLILLSTSSCRQPVHISLNVMYKRVPFSPINRHCMGNGELV